jgi:anti-sigma factor RsiW
MIECRQANNLIDAYLNEELSASWTAELHAHLIACPRCSRELALLDACGDVIATDRIGPVPSDGFADRVLAASREMLAQGARARRRRPFSAWAGAGLAAAAVLALMALPLATVERPGTLILREQVSIGEVDSAELPKEVAQKAMLEYMVETIRTLQPYADESDPTPTLPMSESGVPESGDPDAASIQTPVEELRQILER